jgi:hypothetical protein
MSNVSNPKLWETVKNKVMKMETGGTKAGQWSARKAQMAVKLYKEKGGGYTEKKDLKNSLTKWSDQNWQTKSGKPSHETGERYLPKKAIESLSNKEYRKTSRLKRSSMKKGNQFSKQPEKIAEKTKKYREVPNLSTPFRGGT